MAKCFSVECAVKDKEMFDKGLKSAVLKQMKSTAQDVAKKHKSKGLELDDKCKDGWALTATVTSLAVDDPAKPKTMEATVQVIGMLSGASAKTLKASAGGNTSGLRPNNLEPKAKELIDAIFGDMLTRKIIPAMLK